MSLPSRIWTWVKHGSLVRFAATGGTTFVVDIGLLAILHGALGVKLAVATAMSFCAAFAVNFTLSRQWAFTTGRGQDVKGQMTRFVILVAGNLVVTVLSVSLLSAVGLNYLAAKTAVTVLSAGANFVAYRHWVFSARQTPASAE